MAKDRVITTVGPHSMSLTGTTAATETPSGWQKLGPMLANRMYFKAVFLKSSGAIASTVGSRIAVRAALAPTTADISTAHTSVVKSILSSAQATQSASTFAIMFNQFRLESTGLANTVTAKVFIAAIP